MFSFLIKLVLSFHIKLETSLLNIYVHDETPLLPSLWRGLLMFAFAFPQWHTDWLIKGHFLISSLFFSPPQVCFPPSGLCVCERETVIKSIHLGTRFFSQYKMQHPHTTEITHTIMPTSSAELSPQFTILCNISVIFNNLLLKMFIFSQQSQQRWISNVWWANLNIVALYFITLFLLTRERKKGKPGFQILSLDNFVFNFVFFHKTA